MGSGLGLSINAYRYVENVLNCSSQPVVVDGDALTIVAGNLNLLKLRKHMILDLMELFQQSGKLIRNIQ